MAIRLDAVNAPLASRRASASRRPRVGPRWTVYLALAPLLAIIGLFAYYPAADAVFRSFFDWQPAGTSTFTGGANYVTMINDGVFWQSFRNLGVIFIFSIVAWIFPLLSAELLVSLKSERWQYVMRTLLIIPMAFPAVVTALVWEFMYQPNDGIINRFLGSIGLSSLAHNWTGQSNTALWSLLFVGFPFIAGLPFLIFYSSLQNIPTEVLEAAELDGVGRWRRFWQIDLPLMASQVRILVFLAVVATLQYALVAYLLTNGGPDNATMVPVLWLIDQAFSAGNWGYAATISTVLFVITLLISMVVLLGGRRRASATTDGGAM